MNNFTATLAILTAAIFLTGCGGGYSPKISAENPVNWRGQTYYACKDKVASVLAFEQSGAQNRAPNNASEKAQLQQHLANFLDLKMEPKCHQKPRGGQVSLAIVDNVGASGNFLSAMTSTVPAAAKVQGVWGERFYQQGLARGASKQAMTKLISDGTMTEWVKMAKMLG